MEHISYTLETFCHQIVGTYFIPISHSSQLSWNVCMLMVTCPQSSPIHSHLAAHVIRASFPVVAGLPSMHIWNTPDSSHCDHLLLLRNTSKWDMEQTRRRPVIVTVKDAWIASGTRLVILMPGNQHFPRGCGFQSPTECTYMAELVRATHVSLLKSTSCADFTNDIGGSTSRSVDSTSCLSCDSTTKYFR